MSKTDILTLLTHDHREVEASLQSLITHAGTSAIVDSDRVRKLIDALDLHTKIEEAYLYPKAEKEREASNLVQDFYSEHREIKGPICNCTCKMKRINCFHYYAASGKYRC